MLARVYLFNRLGYAPIRADDVSDAARVLRVGRITSAISQSDFSLSVREKAEGKVELFGKRTVLGFRIEAHAEYLGILVCVLLDSIPESNAFGCSAGRVGFRVKPKHDPTAFQITEPHVFARVCAGGEVGRLVSDLQHTYLLG